MNRLRIGQTLAPSLAVSCWVQGGPIDLSQLLGHVVLLEVFQVNCPGCFLYSLPQAVDLHYRYGDQGLVVIGIATAFEDFDKNTLENLRSLIDSGRVIVKRYECFQKTNNYKMVVGQFACHSR